MEKHLCNFYVVKSGDTLEKIAEKYNISPIKILISNSITPLQIKKGKRLYIKS
ncbi:MAG: LysM peptidoglycan-binding domain-containing protein [Clostridia bacterium]|nr:LysM peptidoglycan-binding domain-containing protein [Clostridia bacterium]